MAQASDRRRYARVKKSVPLRARISFQERPGYPRTEIVADLIDTSEGGCRIGTIMPLGVGSIVFIDRQAIVGGKSESWSARVSWCSIETDGTYRSGLELQAPRVTINGSPNPQATGKSFADHYETLQLNSKADPDTIHRVYRILAQRYHPDNPDTGDELLFRRLMEAYKILSDPEQRAAYDVAYQRENSLRWKIFDQSSAARGREAEKAKRTGILLVLYTRRLNEPGQPSMTLHEIEELLGCPREHLEFSLWFLKEKGYVIKQDNAKYAITANGAEAAEQAEIPWLRQDRLLSDGEKG